MDAKTELERRLVELAPGMEAEIRQALGAYRITWAETGGALALMSGSSHFWRRSGSTACPPKR